jgi:cytosolic phospholipase A2
MGAARLFSSRWKAQLGAYAVLGASTSYGLYATSQRIQCDTNHTVLLPQARPLVTQPYDPPTTSKGSAAISAKRDQADASTKTSDRHDDSGPVFEDEDTSAWHAFSTSLDATRQSLAAANWSSFADTIQDYVLPTWARQIPDNISKLQQELSMAPGSLADDIWEEAKDAYINPEILWDAHVRVGDGLCNEEKAFQAKRKAYTRKALAKYLGIDENDVDEDDVPTIAVCGSGGGLRALVAGTGSYLSAHEAGLYQCVTYTAGVSGSCWLQTLYHSTLAGRDYERLANHLKNRLSIHIAFPPPALNMITRAPTNKFLLSGFVEKLKKDSQADFGLVDIYGLLLAARLLVPRGELEVSDADLKLSNQRVYIDSGDNPMPIYTAVRHEIPLLEQKIKSGDQKPSEAIKEKARQEAWFQWFEFTPYEFFCEEYSSGIPIWALGRQFKDGKNVVSPEGLGSPEMRIPLLMGIWGSAFCATLSHYYKEIRPVVKGLTGFGGIDFLMEEKNEDLIKIHPIEPATIPNFAVGMETKLPSTTPKSIFKHSHIQLMDAGMSNNLPIYPLLRPGRNVDILIAFDASADIKQENWLSIVDGYARQRGIKGWPLGAGWPKVTEKAEETVKKLDEAQARTSQEAFEKVEAARESPKKQEDLKESPTDTPSGDHEETDLGYCNVWVGSTQERSSGSEPPPSKRISGDLSDPSSNIPLMEPDAGIAVIYFPFVANPSKVPNIDPSTSDFMSTWNFIYTPDNVEKVVQLARANFEEGKERTKRVVRAVYERKKKLRLEKEGASRIKRWRKNLRDHGDHFR